MRCQTFSEKEFAMRWLALLAALMPFFLSACASTTVKKDPGPHDRGIRFYRPKPYLLLEPTLPEKESPYAAGELVAISQQWLPDFSEEYSVHVRGGLGVNKTSLKLEDGWNLTDLNVEVDAKFAENLGAVTGLIKEVKPTAVPTGGERAVAPPKASKMVVRATNVPFGLYEAVLSPGADGRKQLYGWRYIGFAPYAPCPISTGGVECTTCDASQIFGLVFVNGIMTFKPLRDINAPDKGHDFVAIPEANPSRVETTPEEMKPSEKKLLELLLDPVKKPLATALKATLTDKDVGIKLDVAERKFTVLVKLAEMEYKSFVGMRKLPEVQDELNKALKSFAKEAIGTDDHDLNIQLRVRGKKD